MLIKLTHDETRALAKIVAFHLGQLIHKDKDADLLEAKYAHSMGMKDLCGKTQESITKRMDVLLKVANDLGKERIAGWS